MSGVFVEGELQFDFGNASDAERLDLPDVPAPQGMKLVDFVVTGTSRTLLVEVKDPSGSSVPHAERVKYARKLMTSELLLDLVPKARDSYTFLHLMERDGKPMLFVVVLGLEGIQMPEDPALLAPLKDRLLAKLRQETQEPWKRKYVEDCLVLTTGNWEKHFPEYPLARRP